MEEKLVPYASINKIAGRRVLVLAPHPDDEVFGCAGAIMRHVEAVDVLQVVIVTNGEYRANVALRPAYGALRQAESRNAALVLGCSSPLFWELPDRSVQYGEQLVGRIVDAIDTLNADLVYAPSVYEMHPDHRAVGMAAVEAVRRQAGKTQLALYEVGMPMARLNTLLDISDLTDRKQRAMACFESQLEEQSYDQQIAALNKFRTYTLGKQVTAAEGYFIVPAHALTTDILGLYTSEYERQRCIGLALVSKDIPLVSILIRSMDRSLLRDALDSVALQTYSNIEVVVINARAQDHHPLGDWCGLFPMRMISLGTPLMRSHAANVGLEHARGDFVMFLDDDDWLAPDHVVNLVTTIQKADNCGVAYTGVEFRGIDRQRTKVAPFNDVFDAGRLRGGNYIPIHAVLFARSLLAHGIRFDENFGVYEDWDFLLQLSQYTNFAHFDHVSAYYRASGTSGVGVLSDEATKRIARCQIFEKWKAIWTGPQVDELVIGTANARLEQHHKEMDALHKELLQMESQIEQKNSHLASHEDELSRLRANLNDTNGVVSDLRSQLREREQAIRASDALIQDVLSSNSWAVTRPARWFFRRIAALKHSLRSRFSARGHQLPKTAVLSQFSALGAVGVALSRVFISRDQEGTYRLSPSHSGYTYVEPQCPTDIDDQIAALGSATSFSIVVPLYNTTAALLEAVIRSVQTQWYPHWTLILVDDASSSMETRTALQGLSHPQIQLLQLDVNQGISGATNAALAVAKGDFIVFMDHDDELTVDCLFELARCVARDQPDFIYSDEDKLNEQGAFTQPHYKPDWSPDTMMSTMFTGHVSCVRRSLLDQVGGLRSEVNGCQDWDFVLRVSEHTARISHVSKVLYHWRIIPASVASDIAAKPYVLEASKRVRAEALLRRGLSGSVEPVTQVPGYFRVNYHLQGSPRISIIIPTRDGGNMLRCCVESIQKRSTYRNFEIVIVDNGSVDNSTLAYLDQLQGEEDIQVVRHDKPFNFSELNNVGVQRVTGQLLVFLNDDTEVLSGDWLERMGGFAQLPHIGAVGAKLVYPKSMKIQHAGVVNLVDGPAHAFLNEDADTPGYFMRNLLEYNWLAVTGACLMIEARKFNAIGTFNTNFPIAYNDIELCIRAVEAGFFNVVCQAVTLIHHESASRGLDDVDPTKVQRLRSELRRLYDTHPGYFQFDPFHNPNLHPAGLNFEIPM